MTMRNLCFPSPQPILALLVAGIFASIATAMQIDEEGTSITAEQLDDVEADSGMLEYFAPKTFDMIIGLKLTAGDGQMQRTLATTVFPTAWPEQQVEIVEVSIPSTFRHDFRELPGGNQQLLLFAPIVAPRSIVEATIKVRITKSHITGPQDPSELSIPRRVPRELKTYTGDSPYIKVSSSEIRKIVREIDDRNPESDWQRIEMLYDWVRENIAYENGELKTVRQALRDRTGDCEELTSTFVALCRAARVPARCVWIPNHCYPEFYLQDAEGNGYWFPCQAAGTRNFGSMPEYLPILQKGDRFKVQEKTQLQRYLADYLKAQKVVGREKPKVEFIRQLLGDAANLKSPDLDGAANPTP